jgi:hypothetical protein
MSDENKLIIDEVEYDRRNFTDLQRNLDDRITRLLSDANRKKERAEELELAANVLISQLAESLSETTTEGEVTEVTDSDILLGN